VDENGAVSLSVRCQHCADRPCIRACLTGAIKNKEIQLVINTPTGKIGRYDDSYIRKGYQVPGALYHHPGGG
jgi:hypothetical protein